MVSCAIVARRALNALFVEVKAEGLHGQPRAAPTMMAATIPLPAALEQMGCDEALWSKIKQKKPFVTESARACSYNSSRQVQKT